MKRYFIISPLLFTYERTRVIFGFPSLFMSKFRKGRDMNFKDAFELMKKGYKVKLPSWGGYWYWDIEKQTIMMQCRPKDTDKGQGDLLDIRETQRVEYG